jgi:hypothetical protein
LEDESETGITSGFFWTANLQDLVLLMVQELDRYRSSQFPTSQMAQDRIWNDYQSWTYGDLDWHEFLGRINQVVVPKVRVIWIGVLQELLEGSDWFCRNARACFYLGSSAGGYGKIHNLGITKITLRKLAKPIPWEDNALFINFISA